MYCSRRYVYVSSLVTKAKQQGKLAPLNFKFQHQSFYFSLIPNRLSGLFPRHDIHIPIMYFFYTAWASFGARVSSRLVDADYTPQPTSIYREENVEKDLSLNWQINTRVDSLQLLAPSRYTAAGAAPFFFFSLLFTAILVFAWSDSAAFGPPITSTIVARHLPLNRQRSVCYSSNSSAPRCCHSKCFVYSSIATSILCKCLAR